MHLTLINNWLTFYISYLNIAKLDKDIDFNQVCTAQPEYTVKSYSK